MPAVKANTMPHNVDAEKSLLGCILIDNEILPEVMDKIAQEDFYLEAHQIIIEAIRKVYLSRKPVDYVTLADQLEMDGNSARAGGVLYLTELTSFTPSSANYMDYYFIVKRDSLNRKLIRASKSIIEFSMKSEDGDDSLDFAQKTIYDVSEEQESSSLKAMNEGDVVGEVIKKFEIISQNKNAYRGIETGFKQLDRMTNGLQRSDLIVLAARPGMGKTSLAMNIVEHAAIDKNYTCAVFSLEMPRVQIVQRLLCAASHVSMESALSGNLSEDDWRKLFLNSERLTKSNIYIDDSSRVTPADILSKCRKLKTTGKKKLDLVMIDYIQLMSSGDKSDGSMENRQQEVATITRNLKIMAKELDVPVIALSQLRRIQTKEPQLSDLRESGAIEQDADIVMFINRPDVTATKEELQATEPNKKIVKGSAELIIAKHRNGSLGRVPLRFIGELTKFVNVEDVGQQEEPGERVLPEPSDENYSEMPEDYEMPPMPNEEPPI